MKSGTMNTNVTSGTGHMEDVLVANSTQSATPTPVVVKAGNFKIQGDCYLSTGQSQITFSTSVVLYVMYLPEVVVASANPITAINDHPEWIMAWKVVDLNVGGTSSNGNAFTFSSRLKRNLNSGDSIALVAVMRDATAQCTMRVNYTAQYWTCAN